MSSARFVILFLFNVHYNTLNLEMWLHFTETVLACWQYKQWEVSKFVPSKVPLPQPSKHHLYKSHHLEQYILKKTTAD